jgi:hypothetical protein
MMRGVFGSSVLLYKIVWLLFAKMLVERVPSRRLATNYKMSNQSRPLRKEDLIITI